MKKSIVAILLVSSVFAAGAKADSCKDIALEVASLAGNADFAPTLVQPCEMGVKFRKAGYTVNKLVEVNDKANAYVSAKFKGTDMEQFTELANAGNVKRGA